MFTRDVLFYIDVHIRYPPSHSLPSIWKHQRLVLLSGGVCSHFNKSSSSLSQKISRKNKNLSFFCLFVKHFDSNHFILFVFFSLPWNCLHLRPDVSSGDPFGVTGLFGRSHRVLHLRLQPTRTVWSRLGMGRLLGQHPIWRQVLPRVCRRRWEGPRHPLHDEPPQQRSRSSGKFWENIPPQLSLEVIWMREHAQN